MKTLVNYIGIIGAVLFIISLFVIMFFQLHQLNETVKAIAASFFLVGCFFGFVWFALFEKYN